MILGLIFFKTNFCHCHYSTGLLVSITNQWCNNEKIEETDNNKCMKWWWDEPWTCYLHKQVTLKIIIQYNPSEDYTVADIRINKVVITEPKNRRIRNKIRKHILIVALYNTYIAFERGEQRKQNLAHRPHSSLWLLEEMKRNEKWP